MKEGWKEACNMLSVDLFSIRDRLDVLCTRMTEYAEKIVECSDYSEEADRAENTAQSLFCVLHQVENAIEEMKRLDGKE